MVVCYDKWSPLARLGWLWCEEIFPVHSGHLVPHLPHLGFFVAPLNEEVDKLVSVVGVILIKRADAADSHEL